ncbi:hypothetical protein PMIN03_010515 [Paraphaeosphaeria minitans]|uniref:Glutamate-1-semialdehyde 2,1-aminomutase n=1 Tax=Paraphaeosphaeria minitans TaxID=565426 RepID=A0A9P6GH15_9PLEO|nr:glutamate-1-semialdehyde 2,1-aminomutase [Paraphaeosphaeria minitans]
MAPPLILSPAASTIADISIIKASTKFSHSTNALAMAAGYTGLSQIYMSAVATNFNAMGDKLRSALQELSQGTKTTVTGLGSMMGIHFLEDEKKDMKE